MKSGNKALAKASALLGMTALALGSPLAIAKDSGWYLGGNVGQSRTKIAEDRIMRDLYYDGFSAASISDNNHDTGYKVLGGYQFNRYFALEASYFDLGEFGFTANTIPAGTLNGNIELRGGAVDLVGLLPITEKLSAFARIGANYAEASDRFHATGAVRVLDPHPEQEDTNYKYGFGLQYAVTKALGIRIEAERYHIDDAVGNHGDADMLSMGLVYRFGQGSVDPETVYTPEEPTAEPVADATPRKVVLSADSLFGFDQSTINPAGRQSLDDLCADLQGVNYSRIRVTGHTDRLGSHDYNMKLSTRRAEAVQDYLVTRCNIPASKIIAVGNDGSNPVTAPGDCLGNTATPNLIACLQPDRRVEVEVSGMEQASSERRVRHTWVVSNR